MLNNTDDIIKYLSVKYELGSDIVEKITRSQFKFTRDMMEQGDLDSVHLQNFGKFAVKPYRKQILEERGFEVRKKDNKIV